MDNKKEDEKKTKVLFVCLGNICRSPAAEEIFRQVVVSHGAEAHFETDSAGTYSGHYGQLPDARMRQHAARRGYRLTHRARTVRTADFEVYDLVVAMDDANRSDLLALAPTVESERKVVRMADYIRSRRADCVPDPYYEGADGFELVLNLLEEACENLYRSLTPSSH